MSQRGVRKVQQVELKPMMLELGDKIRLRGQMMDRMIVLTLSLSIVFSPS